MTIWHWVGLTVAGIVLFIVFFPFSTTDSTRDRIDSLATDAVASVETLELLLLESFPLQVRVVISGYFSDSCTTLERISVKRVENTFKIRLILQRLDDICAEVTVPFERTVPLDVYGLEAGLYTVVADGVSNTFEFTVDNILPETSE